MTPKDILLRKIAKRASRDIKLHNQIHPDKPIHFQEVSEEMYRLYNKKRKKQNRES